MKIEDLMKLVNAGFTKDEIKAIAGTLTNEEQQPSSHGLSNSPQPEQVQPDQAAETSDSAASPGPVREQKTETNDSAIEKLTAQVSQLTSIVQKSNLFRMEQPDVKPDTAEDVIASIIFPTYKGDNK